MKMRGVFVLTLLLGVLTVAFAKDNHTMLMHNHNIVTGKDVPDAEAYSLWLATVKANPDVIRGINLSEEDLETLKRHVEEQAVLYAEYLAEQREAAVSNPASSPEGFAERRLLLVANRILSLRNDLSAEGFATVDTVVQAAKKHMFAPAPGQPEECFSQMCLNYSGSVTWTLSSDGSTLTSSLTVQGNTSYSNCQPCGGATHQVVGEHAWKNISTGALLGGTLNMNGEKVSPPSTEINYTDKQSIAMSDICAEDPVDCGAEEDDDPFIDCSVAGALPPILNILPQFGFKIEAVTTTSISRNKTGLGYYIYTVQDYCSPQGVMVAGVNVSNQLLDTVNTDYWFLLEGFCINSSGWSCVPPLGSFWGSANIVDKSSDKDFTPYSNCSTS